MFDLARVPRRIITTFAVIGLALSAAACGDDDDPTAPTGDLTTAQAEAMMEALVSAGGGFFFFPPVGVDGPAAQPSSENFDETVPCQGGGNVRLTGTITSDTNNDGTGTLSLDVTQVHNGCAATASSDGSTWTFDGAPSLQVSFDWVLTETTISFSGSQSGNIAYASGDLSGTCAMSLSYDFDIGSTGQSISGNVQGSVCGVNVSDNFAGF